MTPAFLLPLILELTKQCILLRMMLSMKGMSSARVTKTKIMLCNSKLTAYDATSSMSIELKHQIAEYSEQVKHLGIERTPDGTAKRPLTQRYKAVGT